MPGSTGIRLVGLPVVDAGPAGRASMGHPGRARPCWGFAAVLGLLLAGCGSSGSTGVSSGSSSTLSQSAGGTVTVWAVWSGAEQTDFGKVLDGFQRQDGVRGQFQSKGDALPTVLGTAIAGGSPPDVAILPQPGLLHDLVARNALKPLDAIVGSTVNGEYGAVWRNLATDRGHLYGVYFKAANKSTVWYNVKVFRASGITTTPTTFDELLSDMATLKQYGVAPFSMCGGSGWTLTDWFENVYLRTAGIEKYNRLAMHQIPWTDPSVTDAFTQLRKVFGDAGNMLGGIQGAVSTPFPDCVSPVFGANPKAAMVYEGDFVGTSIEALSGAPMAGTDFDYFAFPSINGSPPSVSGGGDVAVMLRDTPQAEALMRYLASPAAGAIWARLGGFTSPNRNVALSSYPNSIARRAAQDLIGAGDNVVFDMSDQAPAAFGGTAGSGEWADLQNWLRNVSDVTGAEARLESDARAAYGH
jgi:alpha-glucoside transport system substrate-binding protein